jgi:hypothetical protein
MKKRNHITFAAIFIVVFLIILGYFKIDLIKITPPSILILSIITVFYSLLPDIDHKNSTITWWFFGIGVLGLVLGMLELAFNLPMINAWALMILSTMLLVFTYLAVNLFEHRGIIHSIPVGLLSVIPLFFIFNSFAYCLIGYIAWHSHLVGDGYLLKFK